MKNRTDLLLIIAIVFVLLAAWSDRPAGATTYVRMADGDLADQAAAIVSGRVTAVGAPARNASPSTDYAVEVDRWIKGEGEGQILVRVPGGRAADGRVLKVLGAPQPELGARVLLFLVLRPDGAYAPLHLMLGAFEEESIEGTALALRDLREASALDEGEEPLRAFTPFAEWLADRALGIDRVADYQVERTAERKSAVAQKFALSRLTDGVPLRWFAFDRGQKVNWMLHEAGQPGMGLADSATCFENAMAVWNAVPGANIRLTFSGSNRDSSGLRRQSGGETVLFNDPNADIAGTFQCGQGGVAAIAGVWAEAGTASFGGSPFHTLLEAHIVVNDGTDCLTHDNPKVMEEILAHELGHTLGLGHSAERQALMYPTAHNDGRGASLDVDDLVAISSLYGDGTYVPPSPPITGPPASVPGAPLELKASAAGRGMLSLQWQAGPGTATEFRLERKIGKSFVEIATCAADDLDALVRNLPAGQLFFRIRARNDAGYSPYGKTLAVRMTR